MSDHHQHQDHQDRPMGRALLAVSLLTLVFAGVEVFFGIWSGSLALTSDGIHMLTDSGTLLFSYLIFRLSRIRPARRSLSFGYHRLEILGALSNGLILVFVSGSLLWEAWGRFFEPVFVEGKTVVWVALLGLGVNAIAMRVLHSHHEHSLNARAAYLHVVSDLLGSVGALVSGGLLWWKGWTWIDPAVTVLFSLVMIWGAWRLLREGVEVLLEAAPRRIDLEEVQRALETCSGVERVHDLHVWSLTKSRVALSAHLVVGESNELQNGVLLRQATDLLQSNFGIAHVTLQIESSEFFEDCHTHCAD